MVIRSLLTSPGAKFESRLLGLEVPRAEAEAQFWAKLGQVNPYLSMILQTLRGANSAKALIGK